MRCNALYTHYAPGAREKPRRTLFRRRAALTACARSGILSFLVCSLRPDLRDM